MSGATPTNGTTPTWTWTTGGGGIGTYRLKLDNSDLTTSATTTSIANYTPGTAGTEGSDTLMSRSATQWATGRYPKFSDRDRYHGADCATVTGTTPTNGTAPTWTWTPDRLELDNSDLTTGATTTTIANYTPGAAQTEVIRIPLPSRNATLQATGRYQVALYRDRSYGSHCAYGYRHTPTNDTQPTWTWTTGGSGGNGTYRFRLDNSDLTTGATTTTSASYTAGTVQTEGSHTLYVQERDAAGNWSLSGSFAVEIDITAPTAPTVHRHDADEQHHSDLDVDA